MRHLKLLHIGKEENLHHYPPEATLLQSLSIVSMPMGLPSEQYARSMPDADVLVVDAIARIPGDLIRALPSLKMIHSEGVAFNQIDVETAATCGVCVCNSAGMNAEAVAEQTLLLMLGVLRDVANNDCAVREGRQMPVKERYMTTGTLRSLSDCRVGLIGFGHIGKCTAQILKACHARVFYTQRRRASEEIEQTCQASWVPTQDELLSTCDIISLHLPVTKETEHMCDASFFQKMKPGAYFINTSRGELVDDQALVDALKSGRLSMAGLDTLDHEPVQRNHLLLNQPEDIAAKLLFSPHIGGITESSFRKSYQMIWENVRRIAEGQPPVRVVNHVRL